MMPQRKILIAGNWKMYKTVAEGVDFIRTLENRIDPPEYVEVALFPPFVALETMRHEASLVRLGAQNVAAEVEGAFTGEISAHMLSDLVDMVLVGHSERRHIFGEGDELLNRKLHQVLDHQLTPILCVGETLEEREADRTLERIRSQVEAGLAGVDRDASARVIVAYEPVWAIGTGRTASPEQAQEVHAAIREMLSARIANPNAVRILYGGSVKPENSVALLSQPDIDGALIGGASLRVEAFSAIIQNAFQPNPA